MNFTKDKIGEVTITGEFDIAASVKPEQGSESKKQVTLRFLLNNTPLSEIISSSLKDKRINWQTGARDKFESITSGSIIRVEFKGGKAPVDLKGNAQNYLLSLSKEDRLSFLKEQGLI